MGQCWNRKGSSFQTVKTFIVKGSFIEQVNSHLCASSDEAEVLAEVEGLQAVGQGRVQVRAAEPQTIHWAGYWM